MKVKSEKKVKKSEKKVEIKSEKKKWKKKWNKKCKFRQVTEQSNTLASAVVWVYKALTFWLFFYNQQFVQDIPVYLGKIYF